MREVVGRERFEAAIAKGQAMTYEDLVNRLVERLWFDDPGASVE